MVDHLPNLSKLSAGDKDALIVRLFAAVENLQARVTLLEAENQELRAENQKLRSENQELRGKLAKNSQNSSKPPSTDGYKKPKPKSLRKPRAYANRAAKNRADSKGTPERDLNGWPQYFSQGPDHTILHPVLNCQECGCSLKQSPATGHRSRQVFDIPPMKIEVTEHQVELKSCPHCKCQNEAAFPSEVKISAQYGSPPLWVLASRCWFI